MKTTQRFRRIHTKPLAWMITALSASMATTTNAAEYDFDELNVRIDNTISWGAAWRTEGRDKGQIMPQNAAALDISGEGSSYNYDDGTLNYEQGDVVTNAFKWNGDLQLQYKNYGAFFRGRAYYDYAIMNQDPDFKPYTDATLEDAGRGAELMDAFVYADYDIGRTPVTVRAGRQVLSWGESTFIQGGVSSINPVDASAFRKPGAELKEGLLPVNMLYTSIGISMDVTLEAFYQLEWEKTRSDPCGTFFSTTDFVADGCGPVILGGATEERDILALRQLEIDAGVPLSQRVAPVTERLADDEPRDSGQYGLALRWFASMLDDTELGFYYLNIHSRLPYISGVVTNYSGGAQVNANASYDSKYPLYQIVYPEDTKIYGISFARSTESGASWSGELTYKPDLPIQWNAFEVLLAGNGAPYSRLFQQRAEEAGSSTALFGEVSQGYDEFDVWQLQSTYIMLFDRVFGADRLAIVGEAGLNYIPDLPSTDDARFGRSGAYGIGNNDGVWNAFPNTNFCTADTNPANGATNTGKNVNTDYCTDDGYVTQLSGGIRVRAGLDYNNAFAGMNVTPNVSIAYDKGNGPEPGSQFIDDRLTVGVGATMLYQNQTSFDISYTNFSGGKYNQLKDRDNVSISAKYSF